MNKCVLLSHSLRGSVDWNHNLQTLKQAIPSHSLRGSVDWNIKIFTCDLCCIWSLPTRECGLKFPCGLAGDLDPCHSLRGSVDWNAIDQQSFFQCIVTPYAGVWIEMSVCQNDSWQRTCHSLRGSVDWNYSVEQRFQTFLVTPYAGVWIEMGKYDNCCLEG